MLEDILGPDEYDAEAAGEALQDEAQSEDLEAGYVGDFKPIHFIDPGVVLALIGLNKEDILTKNEVREALGYESVGD